MTTKGKSMRSKPQPIADDVNERKGMEQQLQFGGGLATVGAPAAGVAHKEKRERFGP